MSYTINMLCYNYPDHSNPENEKWEKCFASKCEAESEMLYAVIDELNSLNAPDENNTPHTRVFLADLDGDHDAIIRMWDGDDYMNVTVYDIVESEPDTVCEVVDLHLCR